MLGLISVPRSVRVSPDDSMVDAAIAIDLLNAM